MKIEKQGTVKFEDVKFGQVFEWNGKIFIKGYYPAGRGKNVMVDLYSGYATSPLTDDSEVILHEDAKVVLK